MAGWTPVSFNADLAMPSIDWGDLRQVRFSEPFFDQTVARWAGSPSPRMIRTDLDALEVLDGSPSLEPAAMIFHLSRCGSTLVSRLLAQVPGTLVVAEPGPVNDLLLADLAGPDKAMLLRRMIRALGRKRFDDDRRYVLKLSSWNVRHLTVFRRAFPEAPIVWVQRDPAEVMASLLADPPSWLKPRGVGLLAPLLFGIDGDEAGRLGPAPYAARALASLLRAASPLADDDSALIVDYVDLPGAIWTTVADFLGLQLDPAAVAGLAAESRFYSKATTPRLFTGDAPERHAIAQEVRQVAAALAEDSYSRLDQRRRRAAAERRLPHRVTDGPVLPLATPSMRRRMGLARHRPILTGACHGSSLVAFRRVDLRTAWLLPLVAIEPDLDDGDGRPIDRGVLFFHPGRVGLFRAEP